MSESATPGGTVIAHVTWSKSPLEKIGLTPEDVTSIELYLGIRFGSDWSSPHLFEGSVTF